MSLTNYGSQYNASQIYGPGAQVTAQGTWVPGQNGQYALAPQVSGMTADGAFSGGYGGQNLALPEQAIGSMATPDYSSLTSRAPGQATTVRSPYSGVTSVPSASPYSPDGSYVMMPGQGTSFNPYPNGLPSNLGGATGQPGAQPALSPAAAGVLAMGDTGSSTSPPASSSPSSSDMTSLMAMLTQYGGGQSGQPALPAYSPPSTGGNDTLMSFINELLGTGGGSGAPAATPGNPTYSGGGVQYNGDMFGAGGGMVNYNSIYQDTPGQFGNGVNPVPSNPLGGMINHTFTSVGGVPVNGAQPANLYASDGPPTQPTHLGAPTPPTGASNLYASDGPPTQPSTGGLIGFPLPGGGTFGVPVPAPTVLPNIPATTPGAPPASPWSQPGQGQPVLYPSPAQPSPSPTAPQSWNGVATTGGGISDSLRAMLGANVMGTSDGTGGSYDAIQQAMLSNPSYTQQQQPAPAASIAGAGGGFDFGGSAASGQSTPSPAGQSSQSGNLSSLLSLLGGLPQPPNLSMSMPNVGTDGAFAGMPGGTPSRLNPAPIINDQQMNQLINQATSNNARQAATSQEQAREAMTGNGFSAGSGALGDVNRLVDAQRMNADTAAYSQIPLNASQINNQAMNQAMGLNLQGQQNAISSFNSLSDFLKNQGALGAQQYGLGIQGYSAYQNALGNLLGLGNQQQQNQIAQYGQDLNAYNLQNQAQNNYLQALLSSGQLALQGDNSYNQNLTSLLSVLNGAQGNQNQQLSTLLGALGGLM